jgi:hypothetical protein
MLAKDASERSIFKSDEESKFRIVFGLEELMY